VIATKVGGDFYGPVPRINFSPDYIREALERSLARLQTDHLDLYQLHNPPPRAIADGAVFELLESLKQEGKIRAGGISIFEPEEGIDAIRRFKPASVQVVYNLFNPYAAERLFPMAKSEGVGIVAREPLANGFLTAKYDEDSMFPEGDIRSEWPSGYIAARTAAARQAAGLISDSAMTPAQLALRYALSREEVSVVIPGIKTPEQARENLAASDMGPLEDELMRGIKLAQRREFGL
jgi:aryl-alcohol dehydrogenase-like predicted oxidoreductase